MEKKSRGKVSMLYTISRIILLILISAVGYGITQKFYSRLPRAWKHLIWIFSSMVALLCFLRHYGIEKKEKDLIRPLFLSRNGTASWAMARYLKKHGFRVKILETSQRPENIPVPSIALVRLGNKDGIAHCIIILEETDTHFTIADSLSGRFVWNKEYAYTHYYFEGYLIHVTQ